VRRLSFIIALSVLAGGALAQQKPPKKPTPAPRAVYDEYQASQRQRLRRESCGRAEDMVAAYCVRKCDAGYQPVSHSALPRRCRSLQPLPDGSVPQGLRRQTGVQPLPPARPANPVGGA
jgi:hypothetical protein